MSSSGTAALAASLTLAAVLVATIYFLSSRPSSLARSAAAVSSSSPSRKKKEEEELALQQQQQQELKQEEQMEITIEETESEPRMTKFVVRAPKTNELGEMVVRDVKEVARRLIPEWKVVKEEEMPELVVDVVRGGITNLLFKVSPKYELNGERRIVALVRLYGENTEFVINRELECSLLFHLSKIGFSPKLYGLFSNGRVEGFIEDTESISPKQMSETAIQTMIAVELGRMHALDITFPILKKSPQLWQIIEKFSKSAFSLSFSDDPQKARLFRSLGLHGMLQEIRWLHSQLPSPKNKDGAMLLGGGRLGLSDINDDDYSRYEQIARAFLFEPVLCHNDLLYGNIILCLKENPPRAQLIDFEYGCYNYRGYDIANHFCEYAGFDADFANGYPDRDKKAHFVKEYVRSCAAQPSASPYILDAARLLFPSSTTPTMNSGHIEDQRDALLEHLLHWIDRFALASHLFWGFWSIIQARNSKLDFAFLPYANLRFKGYFMHKEKFFPGIILRAIRSPQTSGTSTKKNGNTTTTS